MLETTHYIIHIFRHFQCITSTNGHNQFGWW